jgi:hypothetical protein
MRTAIIASALLALLLIAGCASNKEEPAPAPSYSVTTVTENGVTYWVVNGIKLKYTGKVSLQTVLKPSELRLNQPQANINLSGKSGKETDLLVSYSEYSPGDASIALQDNGITASTKSGKPVLITEISGSVPKGIKLYLNSLSGNISASGLKGDSRVEFYSSSGALSLRDSEPAAAELRTLSGSVYVRDSKLKLFTGDTSSGKLSLQKTPVTSGALSSISGDIQLTDCKCKKLAIATDSGNIELKGCSVDDLAASTNSGSIDLHDSKVLKKNFTTKAEAEAGGEAKPSNSGPVW